MKRKTKALLEENRRKVLWKISVAEAELRDVDRVFEPIRQSDQPELCKHNSEFQLSYFAANHQKKLEIQDEGWPPSGRTKDCSCDRSCYCRGFTCER
jgi:hypothetical protein